MLRHLKGTRRVVITGMGCVTPIGIGRDAFWRSLTTGESGTRRIESFDVTDSPVKIAAFVRDFDWEAELNPKDRKHVPRTVPLALAAAREALELASNSARAAAASPSRNRLTNTGTSARNTRRASIRFLRQHMADSPPSSRWSSACAASRT